MEHDDPLELVVTHNDRTYSLYLVNRSDRPLHDARVSSYAFTSTDEGIVQSTAAIRDLGSVHPGRFALVESADLDVLELTTVFDARARTAESIAVGGAYTVRRAWGRIVGAARAFEPTLGVEAWIVRRRAR